MAWFKDTRTIDQLVRDVSANTPAEAAPHYKRFATACAIGGTLPLANLGFGIVFYPQAPLLLPTALTPLLYIVAYANYKRYNRLARTR